MTILARNTHGGGTRLDSATRLINFDEGFPSQYGYLPLFMNVHEHINVCTDPHFGAVTGPQAVIIHYSVQVYK